MRFTLFVGLLLSPFFNYAQDSTIRFYPLKEWTLASGIQELSYPLTKGTNYCLVFKNTKSGKFTLFNSKREILLTLEIHENCISWRNTKTEICYFRFEETNGGVVEVGFNRHDLKIGSVAKMN